VVMFNMEKLKNENLVEQHSQVLCLQTWLKKEEMNHPISNRFNTGINCKEVDTLSRSVTQAVLI
jgi:hypothetical protein